MMETAETVATEKPVAAQVTQATAKTNGVSGQNGHVNGEAARESEAANSFAPHAEFDVLKQVPMTVQVEIGRTMMTLGEILDELDVGASIRLDRHAGDPVEVYVNGALFARAEVVLVQDQIGARIIELVNPDKGARGAGLR
jgi:flagellar motor switch protein FliN